MSPSCTPYDVRRLADNDAPFLQALMAVFGDAFDDVETYVGERPDERYLERLLRDESFVALAASDGPHVIGGLTAYFLPKPERARSELYLYDLAVAAGYRRQGMATALIETLKDIATAGDAGMIFVQADHGDDPAIALYTKLGVREDVLHFDIAPG